MQCQALWLDYDSFVRWRQGINNNIPLCEDQASVQAGAGLGPMGVISPRLRWLHTSHQLAACLCHAPSSGAWFSWALAAAGAGLEASLHTDATDRRLNNHLPSLHTDCESCFYSADCHPSIHNKFEKTTNGGEKFGVTIIAMDKVR